MNDVPAPLLKTIFEEWKRRYGPTYPLYGNETVRHDISGSVRPLLPSTEISHEKVLAAQSEVPLKVIQRMVSGEVEMVSYDVADRLVSAMDAEYEWFDTLADYY